MPWIPLAIIGGLTKMIYDVYQSGEDRQRLEDEQERARQENRRQWEEEVALQKEVSSPKYQVSRLQEAGLNPYAFMGGLSTGNFQVAKGPVQEFPRKVSKNVESMDAMLGILEIVKSFQSIKMQDEQNELINLQQQLGKVNLLKGMADAETDSEYKTLQKDNLQADLLLKMSQISSEKELDEALSGTDSLKGLKAWFKAWSKARARKGSSMSFR